MAPFLTTKRDRGFRGDRISGLPDDIILTFLSPMGMKEAARTSILSKRWRNLWATRTHLDFDPKHHELDLVYSTQKDKYINWVNQVVGLHCSSNPCIDTFRIHLNFYSCNSKDAHHVDRWVKFALSRKVKNLELNTWSGGRAYPFGFDILKQSVGIGDSGITSLTSLHLEYVGVSGDFIEFLLSKCRHLERLYVRESPLLVRLKVIGLSLKLKQLTILDCMKLEELEIDDVNLTYFNYSCGDFGLNVNSVLKSVPMLVEATFSGSYLVSPASIFKQISQLASQLRKLTLDMKNHCFPRASLPIFSNLKHLDLIIPFLNASLDNLRLVLEACPVLHEFKFEIRWYEPETLDEADVLVEMDLCHSEGLGFGVEGGFQLEVENTHPNLTLLEVVGYMGCDYDIDIILFVMASASKLETIICNCILHHRYDLVETARARACKLKKSIPPKFCVIII